MLVSLEQVKEHLRIGHEEDDNMLSGYIAAALGQALAYTGDPTLANLDPEEHPGVAHALIAGVTALYDLGPSTDLRPIMLPWLASYRAWEF